MDQIQPKHLAFTFSALSLVQEAQEPMSPKIGVLSFETGVGCKNSHRPLDILFKELQIKIDIAILKLSKFP